MQRVHLAGLDMNLLVALDALLSERSVTRAASRIGLTQPAMSHALGRLRTLLDDPLFVRSRRGMEPTVRALGIAPTLARALADIEGAIAEPPKFEPRTSTRRFTISTSDYMELVLLPAFVARVAKAAPSVDLRVGVSIGLDGLADGSLDLAFRPLQEDPKPHFHAEAIFRERFVCLVRKGHALAGRKLTLERYCAASHVLIAPGGTTSGGVVDEQLGRLGRTRRVALVLQHFLVAPHVVAQSDLIVTIGESVARTFCKQLPLAVLEPPLELPPLTMAQYWHERQAHDPAHAWLRSELHAAARSVAPPPRRAR